MNQKKAHSAQAEWAFFCPQPPVKLGRSGTMPAKPPIQDFKSKLKMLDLKSEISNLKS
jgi:hypothetical protein